MSQIQPQHEYAQDLDTVADGVRKSLEALYETVSDDGHEEAAATIAEIWGGVAQLDLARQQVEHLLAGALTALDDQEQQVKRALLEKALSDHERDMHKTHGKALSRRQLAGKIALDGDMPLPDVQRVLDVLFGDKSTFEEYQLERVYMAMRVLGDALFEEQVDEAAQDEAE